MTVIGCHQYVGPPKINFSINLILNFHQVRQGLKTYSNWPTYPQVYVKGELIGGLDIITVGVIRGLKMFYSTLSFY